MVAAVLTGARSSNIVISYQQKIDGRKEDGMSESISRQTNHTPTLDISIRHTFQVQMEMK